MNSRVETILKDLRSRLDALYGDRLVRLVLYGSHARGDAGEESDIDVLIVLKGPFDYWEELRRTEEAMASVCLEYDVVVSTVFLTPEEAELSRHPLPANIRREGITV